MKYFRQTILKKAHIKQAFVFILFFFINININLLCAQNIESIYLSELKTGDHIYVITNRVKEPLAKTFTFKNQVNEKQPLLFLKVTYHKPDSISNKQLEYNEFIKEISGISSDWLLFVHGDSKTYEQSVLRAFDIQHLHNINVIVFSWPSKDQNINGLRNFKNSKKNVLKSMAHFVETIHIMNEFRNQNKSFKEKSHLSLFIHSLGNYYLENLANNNNITKEFNPVFDNVIINSAAVNQKMHKNWVEKLTFQKRIFITNNISDFSLKGVHIFTKAGKQLGEKITHPIAKNAKYVQFTEAIGFRTPTGTTHTYFIGKIADGSKNIREFYFNIMHGNDVDLSNKSKFGPRKDSIGYDIKF